MKWPWPKQVKVVRLSDLTNTKLLREFLFDTQFDDPATLSRHLSLSPISDEVAASERAASNRRVSQIGHLFPIFEAYAHTVAEGMTQGLLENGTIDPEAEHSMHHVLETAALGALLGASAQLGHIGLMQFPEVKQG
jgi:hypothetical protein